MSDITSKFIREYKRESKSPFADKSTILLLAEHTLNENGEIELTYGNYIYQHRDACGRVLGVSLSKSIAAQHPEFDSRYLNEADMALVMLIYKDEICEFCTLFEDEFKLIFCLPPLIYFEAMEQEWVKQLENI